jgi:hypothetical protein
MTESIVVGSNFTRDDHTASMSSQNDASNKSVLVPVVSVDATSILTQPQPPVLLVSDAVRGIKQPVPIGKSCLCITPTAPIMPQNIPLSVQATDALTDLNHVNPVRTQMTTPLQLQTGDILLFSGTSILSWMLRLGQQSRYSHTALVLRDPTWIHPSFTGLYVMDTGIQKKPDLVTGKKEIGVQLQRFEDVFDPSWRVWVRRVHCVRDATFLHKVQSYWNQVETASYDLTITHWLGALALVNMPWLTSVLHLQSTRSYWCAAMVAMFFVQIGLLPPKTSWSLMSPKSFGSKSYVSRIVPWITSKCRLDTADIRLQQASDAC